MKALVLVLTALMVSAIAVTTMGVQRVAAETPKPRSSLEFLGATPAKAKGQLMLSVRLSGSDGKPLSNQPVDFYEKVELLGSRAAHLGTATTDATGTAALAYFPAELGTKTIAARFVGDEDYATTEVLSQVDVRDAVAPYEFEPLPLAPVSRWLPIGVGVIVLCVWVVLLGVFGATVLGIRAAGNRVVDRSAPAVAVLDGPECQIGMTGGVG